MIKQCDSYGVIDASAWLYVWQRGFTPHRLAIPREGHAKGINHELNIVFRADARAHALAPGRQRVIALAGDRSRSLTAI